jgi:hypothetical protein
VERVNWNPPASWYEPPEPVICCALAEDEEGHDSEACMAESAEAAAEAKAERQREEAMLRDW